jgi:putative oxidoreductase
MPGDAGTFADFLIRTNYMTVVKLCEIIFGAMLIFPKTRALGFILIAPVVFNILLFEVCIAKQPGIGVVLFILNILGLYLNKSKYEGILQ